MSLNTSERKIEASLPNHCSSGTFRSFNLPEGWEVRKARRYPNAVILGKCGVPTCLIASQTDDEYLIHIHQVAPEVLAHSDLPRDEAEFKLHHWFSFRALLEAFAAAGTAFLADQNSPAAAAVWEASRERR